MTGHHPFSKLRKRMAPARRGRNARATRRMLANMMPARQLKRPPRYLS
jgi:hypothetical protein